MLASAPRASLRGLSLMIRGCRKSKKNSVPLLLEKKIQTAPLREIKNSRTTLLMAKKIGPHLIGLYKETNFFGVPLWGNEIWEASSKKKKLGKPPWKKKYLSEAVPGEKFPFKKSLRATPP